MATAEPFLPGSQQPLNCYPCLLVLLSPARSLGPTQPLVVPGRGCCGRVMAAGGRRRRPLRYQSLAALVEDSQWPFLFLVSDFSYGADDYDGEGNEEQKGPPEGSETMPYIDESPTMSPQLSARNQDGGDSISPTPPEGLAPAVGTPAFLPGFREERAFGEGGGRHRCHGPGSAWDTTWRADWGRVDLPSVAALMLAFQS